MVKPLKKGYKRMLTALIEKFLLYYKMFSMSNIRAVETIARKIDGSSKV